MLKGLLRVALALVLCASGLLAYAPISLAQIGDNVKTGSLDELNESLAITMAGRSSVAVVISGTWTGTLTPEISVDGSTWEVTQFYDPSGTARAATTTGNGTFMILCPAAMNNARVKATAYSSGTAEVVLRASAGSLSLPADVATSAPGSSAAGLVVRTLTSTGSSADQVQGTAASGSAPVGNPVLMGGSQGSGGTVQTLHVGPNGDLFVTLQASTSAIGKLSANSGVDIGDVDILSIAAGDSNIGNVDVVSGPTGASSLAIQGAAASGSAPVGNPLPIAGARSGGGTLQTLQVNANGVMAVALDASSSVVGAVTQSGTWTATAPSTGSIGSASAFPMGAVDPSGNVVIPKAGADSSLFVTLQASSSAIGKLSANSGVDIGDVDVTSIVMPTGASAAQVQGTVADGSAAAQNPVQMAGKDGAGNIQAMLTDTGGALQVDVESGSVSVTGTVTVGGVAADGAAVSGNPVRVAGKDASGNTQDLVTGLDGSLYVTLQASTSAIGKLAANSGVDIGDVDILSIAAGDTNIGNVDIASAIPAGTNYIGKVRQTDGTNDVNAFVDADSGVGTEYREGVVLRKIASGGSVEAGTAADPLRVDPTGSTTQPVSGTVTANAGTGTFTVAGTATVTQGASTSLSWPVMISNGSGTQQGTSGSPLRVDPTGSTTQPVSGTFWQATQPVSGTVTANAGTGTFTSGGVAADGSAVSGNPVRIGGKDGSGNTQDVLTDTSGAVQVDVESIAAGDNNIGNVDIVSGPTGASALQLQGTQASGSALVGNPVVVAGSAGANAVVLKTDSGGAVQADIESIAAGDNNIGNVDVASIAAGDNNIGNVDIASIAAGDNNVGNVDIVTGPTGATALQTQGTVADGSAAAQNPVQIGGKDGSGNIQTISTDTTGAVQVDIESGTVTANAGTGTFTVGGAAADGAAVSGNPTRVAGKDGSGNTQDILTDTGGAVQVDVESIAAGDNNIGNVDVASLPALSTGPIASNPQTSVGTSVATQLIVASTPCKRVTIQFDDLAATNGASGVMIVGGSSVSATNGVGLRAGQSLTLEVGNANTIWLFCTTASQKVSWIAEN